MRISRTQNEFQIQAEKQDFPLLWESEEGNMMKKDEKGVSPKSSINGVTQKPTTMFQVFEGIWIQPAAVQTIGPLMSIQTVSLWTDYHTIAYPSLEVIQNWL